MLKNRSKEIHRINYLTYETEGLYHQASLKMGISDSVCIVLYAIYDAGGSCLLRDIYKHSGVSKQTINSALRSLEAKQLIQLEQYSGKLKRAVLTPQGNSFAGETVGRLFEAETHTFDDWQEGEISTYIRLMEKYTDSLRRQLQIL